MEAPEVEEQGLSPEWQARYDRLRSVPILYYPLATVFYVCLTAIGLASLLLTFAVVLAFAAIFLPIYLAAVLLVRTYQVIAMLFGFWWCGICGERHWGIQDKTRIRQVVKTFASYSYRSAVCCQSCHDQRNGRELSSSLKLNKWKL